MNQQNEELEAVYTEVTTDFNLKPRYIRCPGCNLMVRSALPDPHCGKCHRPMYTVVEPRTAAGSLD
jgi:Zn finger protein HypA/HybF involved in hydrogenase expression